MKGWVKFSTGVLSHLKEGEHENMTLTRIMRNEDMIKMTCYMNFFLIFVGGLINIVYLYSVER